MPRPTKRAGARVAARVERKFTLSAEAVRRLDVHAACEGLRPAAVVEQLILRHLRRWVASDRGEVTADGRGEEG